MLSYSTVCPLLYSEFDKNIFLNNFTTVSYPMADMVYYAPCWNRNTMARIKSKLSKHLQEK